jgi:ComF family protein
LVKVYKFGHQRVAADSLVKLMVPTILNFNSVDHLRVKNYLVVAVPTATGRIRHRSFDHSSYLARGIARELGFNHMNALTRIGQTRQVGAERSIRLKQAHGNYIVKYPNLITDRNILLIDDVVTTGATLRAVTKAIRAAGAAQIDALVFAKRL